MNIARKTLGALLLVAFTATPLLAATQETAEFRKNYGTVKTKVQPRGIDKTAVNLSKQYAAGKNTPKPIMGQNGAVVYQYGSTVVRVICRTLRITDIELEEGETVTSAPFIGDSINWQILPSASGSGDKLKYHIMIKPSMPDLSTNLVVHTDRRSYHFELVSSKTDHTPLIKFSYPQMQTQQGGATGWQEFIAQRVAKKQAQENEYKIPYFDAGVMDDDYVIQGKKSIKWFPKRVYTDGIKTYIEFNNNLSNIESPVFMIVRNNSREMVNYRQIGNIFVVDYLFDVGILLAGSGGQQQKVVIRRVTTGRKPETLTEEYVPARMTETDENGKVIENYVSASATTAKTFEEIVAERKAKEETEAKAEADRKASEAEERAKKEKILRERLARLEARKKESEAQAEVERKAREAAEAEKAKELAERQARIEAEEKRLEEAKRKAEEEAERKAKAAEERARKEAEARQKALAEKQARIEAEQKRLAEKKARAAEAERVRKEAEAAKAAKEAEQKAKLQDIQKKKLDILKRIEEIQKNRQK